MSLPKCRLCGCAPESAATDEPYDVVWCAGERCNLEHRYMTSYQWRLLMSPPPVTDAMVERVTAAARGAGYGIGDDLARIVLEAALNPKEA